MKRIAAVMPLLLGCGSTTVPPVAPTAIPGPSTTCYAGLALGMGQRSRTIARRTVDPAAHQIVEDVSHDDSGAHGARSFHVVMTVDGDHFTMAETGGAFAGNGTLTGEPWRWSSWSSTSQIPKTGITVDSDDELTPTGMKATKQIRKDGKVIASTSEELAAFDCAEWDKFKAALAVPILDAAACERACRNHATLKYWQVADAELAQIPPASRDAARRQKVSDFAQKLEAGLASCTSQCTTANNAVQTACLGDAKTAAALAACEQD